MSSSTSQAPVDETLDNPWPPLWAMVLGFFMIMVDMTIVTVATPAITEELGAGVNEVIWVTSAYLLTYAVPILITGRLGDRFGAKNLFMTGLVVFTLSSLWCGLAGDVQTLIAARAVQGLGAAMMTPQTMAVITKIFPAARRGSAMALWGATAGVATLVGPILGGFLTEHLGWEWVFFINIPVGVLSFVLTWRLVPSLATHRHSFDWLGVALSGVGMFLLVFGIQEGHQYDWGHIAGPFTVWGLIAFGVVLMAAFVYWQSQNRREPLLPLHLFSDRNFSVSTIATSTLGFAFTAMGFPVMFYAQAVRGYTATEAGLLMAPMAVMSILLARFAGQLTDRVHPRILTVFGFSSAVVALGWFALAMEPDAPLWELCLSLALLGAGTSFLFGPLAATANRNLPMAQAGAGAGVFNATRQFGAVLGSAAVAVLLDARMAAHGFGGFSGGEAGASSTGAMPPQVADEFASAMAETLWLVPAVLLVGLLAVLFLERPRHFAAVGSARP